VYAYGIEFSFDGKPEGKRLPSQVTKAALRRRRTNRISQRPLPQIVSLFCGAGGMDLGFREAGFAIAVAFDSSAAAISTHRHNFRRTNSVEADLVKLKPSGVCARVREHIPLRARIGVIGGPPCQGFSRANPRAQPDDPRNDLLSLYVAIVRKLKLDYTVDFVVFENVLGIRDRKNVERYNALLAQLGRLGFTVTEKELCALDFGVPQTRRRVLLSAMRSGGKFETVRPRKRKGRATVKEAIGGIKRAPTYFRRGLSPQTFPEHPNHWTMKPKSPRFRDPDAVSVDGRSFKRLEWRLPSPTIAFGNREIYIHPTGKRRISLFEALLLQGFPKAFVLKGNLSEQVEQISNAVPPPLARSVARAVRRSLRQP
jgi:DNA (cytosine-5)-methyltransferase 1